MIKEYKIRQDLYHKTCKAFNDTFEINNTNCVQLENYTQNELIESIVKYLTVPENKLIYPSKSYAVALIYAKLIELHFGESFYEALSDPELLYKNDPYFTPYNVESKVVYDAVIQQVPIVLQRNIPQIQATIEYFNKEFLLS